MPRPLNVSDFFIIGGLRFDILPEPEGLQVVVWTNPIDREPLPSVFPSEKEAMRGILNYLETI